MTFKFFQKKSVDEACTEHSDCETLYCSAEYQTCRPLHDEWQVSPNVADDPCECIPVTEHENERYYGCDPFSANMNKDPLFGETKAPWCQTKNPDECDKKVPYTNFINVFTTYAGMSNVTTIRAGIRCLPTKPFYQASPRYRVTSGSTITTTQSLAKFHGTKTGRSVVERKKRR